ncbi:hypothetical protein WJX72_009614 [[Myrmecia] bisecta]|uniref:Uncharacterized protein n=1 Tax=[Myrmecia] bisecta TaxID=41462 RepID=A0AAW1PH31_9CHLO
MVFLTSSQAQRFVAANRGRVKRCADAYFIYDAPSGLWTRDNSKSRLLELVENTPNLGMWSDETKHKIDMLNYTPHMFEDKDFLDETDHANANFMHFTNGVLDMKQRRFFDPSNPNHRLQDPKNEDYIRTAGFAAACLHILLDYLALLEQEGYLATVDQEAAEWVEQHDPLQRASEQNLPITNNTADKVAVKAFNAAVRAVKGGAGLLDQKIKCMVKAAQLGLEEAKSDGSMFWRGIKYHASPESEL